MTSQHQLYTALYLAWGILLLVTAGVQKDPQGRRACLQAVGGFAILGINLFVAHPLFHMALTATALAILATAGLRAIRVRQGR